jgi:hypothetical protein
MMAFPAAIMEALKFSSPINTEMNVSANSQVILSCDVSM